MKVIDLLNKIANGEKYPKIKFNNSIYEYHDIEHGYCRHYHDNTYVCLDTDYYLFDILNDEVEIIEEDKKIEKIKDINIDHCRDGKLYEHLTKGEIALDIQTIRHKLDEIIDKLNKGE